MLTGVRTIEVRNASPGQFDLDEAIWRIPPEGVKQLPAVYELRVVRFLIIWSRFPVRLSTWCGKCCRSPVDASCCSLVETIQAR
jgi:hypothetical protein